MIIVLHRPPRDSLSSRVSLDWRYEKGWFLRSPRITCPSESSDLLMFAASSERTSSPEMPEFLAHSEPARSTRCNLPWYSMVPPERAAAQRDTRSVTTQCERLERSFILVSPTCRRFWAQRSSATTSSGSRTWRSSQADGSRG